MIIHCLTYNACTVIYKLTQIMLFRKHISLGYFYDVLFTAGVLDVQKIFVLILYDVIKNIITLLGIQHKFFVCLHGEYNTSLA